MRLVGALVDRAMFPGTEPSYDMASFEELFFLPLQGGGQQYKVPCVLFPYYKGSPFLIIYAHGNGSDVGDILGRLEELAFSVQAHVLGFDYPGYGCALGQADVARVDEVLSAVIAFATGELGWPLENIVLFGCSIGTGPCTRFARNIAQKRFQKDTAVPPVSPSVLRHHNRGVGGQTASEGLSDRPSSPPWSPERCFRPSHELLLPDRKLGGLILQCPYRSIRHAAERFIGKLMARILVEAHWDIEKEIAKCECPILWIHGKRDDMFDWKGSQAMYEQYYNNFKMIHLPEDATHLTFDFDADLVVPIRTFLRNLVAPNMCPAPHFTSCLRLGSDRLRAPLFPCEVPIVPVASHRLHAAVVDVLSTWIESPHQCRLLDAADAEEACEEDVSHEQPAAREKNTNNQLLMSWPAVEDTVAETDDVSQTHASAQVPIGVDAQGRPQIFAKRVFIPRRLPRGFEITSPPASETALHKFWPWSKFQSAVIRAVRSLGTCLCTEVVSRHVPDYSSTERFVATAHWVRRFFALRFRHTLGMDVIYQRQRTTQHAASAGSTIWDIHGIVVAGVLLRLDAKATLRVEALPPVLGHDNPLYTSQDYLVVPVFSCPKDFIFPLARWLILAAAEHERLSLNRTPGESTRTAETNQLLTDRPESLTEFGSNYLCDFSSQDRRPMVERLGFEFGNHFPYGWDSLLQKLLDDWDWFKPRILLNAGLHNTGPSAAAYLCIRGWRPNPAWLTMDGRTPRYASSEGSFPSLPAVASAIPAPVMVDERHDAVMSQSSTQSPKQESQTASPRRAQFGCPTIELRHDERLMRLAQWWTARLDSRFPTDPEKCMQDPTPHGVVHDRRQYIARCRKWDKTKRPSICYHHVFHLVLLRPGFAVPELFARIDALWRLVEILTGVECEPQSTTTQPREKEAQDTPSPLQSAFLVNLSFSIMFVRRLLNNARSQFSPTATTPPGIDALLVVARAKLPPFLSRQYPGVVSPSVRLLDELRFALLSGSQIWDMGQVVRDVPLLGYHQEVHGWQTGCYGVGGMSCLIVELEDLLATLYDALEAVDTNMPVPLASSRPPAHHSICNYMPSDVIVKVSEDRHVRWAPVPMPPGEARRLSSAARVLHEVFMRYLLSPRNKRSSWWRQDFTWVTKPLQRISLPPRPIDLVRQEQRDQEVAASSVLTTQRGLTMHSLLIAKHVEQLASPPPPRPSPLESLCHAEPPRSLAAVALPGTHASGGGRHQTDPSQHEERKAFIEKSNSVLSDSSTSDRAPSDFASAGSGSWSGELLDSAVATAQVAK